MAKRLRKPFIREIPYLESDFQVNFFEDNGNPNVSLHHHPYFELFILVQGDIVYNAGNHYFSLNKGDIICNGLAPEFVASLSSDELNLADCFDQETPKIFRFPAEIRCTIMTSVNKLLEANELKPVGAGILSRAYIAEILTKINTAVRDKKNVLTRRSVSNEEIISIVCSYMDENIAAELDIDDLAEIACMSKYHFMRTFKTYTGESIYQYILRQKALSALQMALLGTTLSEAAAYYGFNEYSSFYRTCINNFSKAPNELLEHFRYDANAFTDYSF